MLTVNAEYPAVPASGKIRDRLPERFSVINRRGMKQTGLLIHQHHRKSLPVKLFRQFTAGKQLTIQNTVHTVFCQSSQTFQLFVPVIIAKGNQQPVAVFPRLPERKVGKRGPKRITEFRDHEPDRLRPAALQ